MRPLLIFAALATLAHGATAEKETAEPSEPAAEASRLGPPRVMQYRIGAEITATRGPCRDIVAMVCVPLDCPEQQVKILNEDFSTEVREVTERNLGGGARQMMISVPALPDGATARAVLTVEVTTHTILPPEETDHLKIPQKLDRNLRKYISGSPYIEVNHRLIKSLSKEIMSGVDPAATDWEKIEAIYDKVLEKVEYVEGIDKSALDSLRDGQADCQGRSMLFIALCRANKIPARMVWVDGHAYAEFYLESEAASRLGEPGKGEWYPIESAGTRAFGEMPLARPILQKGDNFRVPERKERLRYASDYLIGYPIPGSGKPKAQYIRQQVTQ
ncbi:MAG: transglutaminase-like domain-containing protein [Pirellulales bacterium]